MRLDARIALFPLVGLAVLLAGCGSGGQAPEDGGRIVHRGNGTEPASLDPHLMTGHPEFLIAWTLFEGLTTLNPETLEPQPGVAQSWDVSRDGRTVTFFLRPNARWSNGDRVTAGDFAFAWKRILSPALAASYAGFLYCIEGAEDFSKGKIEFSEVGVETPESLTLRVRLTRPTPHFLFMQAMPFFFPAHEASLVKHGAADRRDTRWTRAGNLVSNGAFLLARWQPNRILSARRNPHYWGADRVRIDGVDFHPIESLQTEERAFRTGRLHWTHSLAPNKIDAYRRDNPHLLHIHPMFGTYFYRFNTTRKPLDDPRVRRALAMCVDREDIVQNIARGGQEPARRLAPPMDAYPGKAGIAYDPEGARNLLAEAGYPGGRGFPSLSLLYNTSEGHRAIAQAVQHMWKTELGIDIELMNQDWKVYLSTVKQLDYDIARGSWIGDYFDAMSFLELFESHSPHNRCGYANKEYDGLIAKALNSADESARAMYLARAEGVLMNDAPIAPIYHYANIYLKAPELRGVAGNAMNYQLCRDMYFAESATPVPSGGR